MGYIRKTPDTLGALKPTRDDINDAPVNPKGPARGPRGTRSITPSGQRINDQKA